MTKPKKSEEPDFIVKSTPWSEADQKEFSALIKKKKAELDSKKKTEIKKAFAKIVQEKQTV